MSSFGEKEALLLRGLPPPPTIGLVFELVVSDTKLVFSMGRIDELVVSDRYSW